MFSSAMLSKQCLFKHCRPKHAQKPTLFEGARIPIGARAADTRTPAQEAVVAGGLCRYCGRSPNVDGRRRAGREQRELHESSPDIEGAWGHAVTIAVRLGEKGGSAEGTAKESSERLTPVNTLSRVLRNHVDSSVPARVAAARTMTAHPPARSNPASCTPCWRRPAGTQLRGSPPLLARIAAACGADAAVRQAAQAPRDHAPSRAVIGARPAGNISGRQPPGPRRYHLVLRSRLGTCRRGPTPATAASGARRAA